MLSLRDLVKERLQTLGIRQQDLATRLGIDPGQLSGVLTGQRSVPLDKAAEWVRALDLAGAAGDELIDAMHLAGSTDRVRDLVDRLQGSRDAAVEALARYRDRVGEVLYILTYIEPAPGGGRPPPPLTEPADLLRVLAELLNERNRIAHALPRVADGPARPPEPSAS
jgi:transcriptional regulator with XRE-family HTH domain